MSTILQDLKFAARLLRRSPGFAAVAIAALALGIGANTAIFSVVNTLLLRPLPYRDPGRLVMVWEVSSRTGKDNVGSPGNYLHWRELASSFEEMGIVGMTFRTTLSGQGDPEELPMQYVSASTFHVLGVNAALGRTFAPDEEQPNHTGFVVLSDRLWRRRFGADPGIVDRVVRLDGNPSVVVGVMPPGFSILDKDVEVWRPAGFSAESRTPRGRWLHVVARLKPGVSVAQAQQDMQRVQVEMIRLFPAFNTGWGVHVVSRGRHFPRRVPHRTLSLSPGPCSSSPARTSRIFCWRVRRRASASSPSVPHSARTARD